MSELDDLTRAGNPYAGQAKRALQAALWPAIGYHLGCLRDAASKLLPTFDEGDPEGAMLEAVVSVVGELELQAEAALLRLEGAIVVPGDVRQDH